MKNTEKICWIVTNSNAGVLNQALGLAESIGIKTRIKHVQRKFPFSLIPPILKLIGRWSINFTTKNSAQLEAPWPDLVIACGSQSVHFCLYIKEKSKGKTFCIFLQDPTISSSNFDLVIKMKHDSIKGENVIKTNLALNRITSQKLEKVKKPPPLLFKKYKQPFNTILIGGSTKRNTMNQAACDDILKTIQRLIIDQPNTTFLITPSRRTPKYLVELLHNHFSNNKQIYIHNLNSKTNPYLAMLSLAEKIFVTNDSVSMISEACSTGKPVYIIKVKGFEKGKPAIFSNNLIEDKIVSLYDKQAHNTAPSLPQLNETKRIAQKVQEILIKQNRFSQKDFIAY